MFRAGQGPKLQTFKDDCWVVLYGKAPRRVAKQFSLGLGEGSGISPRFALYWPFVEHNVCYNPIGNEDP